MAKLEIRIKDGLRVRDELGGGDKEKNPVERLFAAKSSLDNLPQNLRLAQLLAQYNRYIRVKKAIQRLRETKGGEGK